MSLQMFVSALQSEGVSVEIATAVYNYYESFTLMRRLSITPDDRRHRLFGATDEDLLDDASLILRRLGISTTEGELADFGASRSELLNLREPERVTFADMARFLEGAKRQFSSSS